MKTCWLLLLLASSCWALTITQAEYYYDTDPGPGNGIAIALTNAGTDSAWAEFPAPAAGSLPPGLHKVYVRVRSDNGVWSGAEGRYYFTFSPWTVNYQTPLITQVEYYFDNLPPVVVDVTDSTHAGFAEPVSVAGLDFGVHRYFVRYRDSRGYASGSEGRYGYIVSPPPTPFVGNHLVGGEYWVNVDPGTGNGIPFGPADDGAWDEGEEATEVQLEGLPLGTHFIGLRFRDSRGAWTPTVQDTMVIGPVLTIRRAGNSIVLDWIPGHETVGRPFHVWRALQSGGPFTEVDTTSSVTWTDTDALSTPDRRIYYIRQTITEGERSTFRLPPE